MSAACCCAKACRRCAHAALRRARTRARRCRATPTTPRWCANAWSRTAMPVGAVRLHRRPAGEAPRRARPAEQRVASQRCATSIESAQSEVLLQTPYLVLSDAGAGAVPRAAAARDAAARDGVDQQPGRDRRVHRLRAVAQVQAPLPARVRLPHLRVQAVPGATRRSTWRRSPPGAERRSQARGAARRRRKSDGNDGTKLPPQQHGAKPWPRATSAAVAAAPTRRCRSSAPACASACMPSRW